MAGMPYRGSGVKSVTGMVKGNLSEDVTGIYGKGTIRNGGEVGAVSEGVKVRPLWRGCYPGRRGVAYLV